ncbi:MAG: diphosphate--fructose-6-phosphate 1-phosphotransferase [Paludibacteraceae bacterium]|nr:diphosphate--fructose-6-phosphate 1-phosphotransferase [Paludibacteraceae bacterium]
MKKSLIEFERGLYKPKLPETLRFGVELQKRETVEVADEIKDIFPHTSGLPVVRFLRGEEKKYEPINVGVILSGGQAPGGHNVIAGLFDGLNHFNSRCRLYGFIGGPSGLIDHQYIEISFDQVDECRNTGGFDMIGSGRTKLETEEQFEKGREICEKLGIKALVIIGGDDSNTNACVLAEYYKRKGYNIQVVGCPKTIDGDLKNEYIETSFGFDTACKVYSELIGNVQRDAISAKKYWHFVRLMGRSASHITLECALQTQPNVAIISEEVSAKKMSLNDIVDVIVDSVVKRAEGGQNFGTVIVPEGLIEFVPEMKKLIKELNDALVSDSEEYSKLRTDDDKRYYVMQSLSRESRDFYVTLPNKIAKQLALDRDPHGNVQVSKIETEELLIELCTQKLKRMAEEGTFKGKFSALSHFFGYEGRCSYPTNFDSNYCYTLGFTSAALIMEGMTGYMVSIKHLTAPSDQWIAGGVPFTSMMTLEKRKGVVKPVIRKTLVDLDDEPFSFFEAHRAEWADATNTYLYPGPIQYYGPTELCDATTITLQLEHPYHHS